jgi:uncharacterized protein YbjQ (UPF0145 family)
MILAATPSLEYHRFASYVGIDLDFAIVGQGGSVLMVTASGTAVVVE